MSQETKGPSPGQRFTRRAALGGLAAAFVVPASARVVRAQGVPPPGPPEGCLGRHRHASALLDDGRVLVCGGVGCTGQPLASAQIYDPATNTLLEAAAMGTPRTDHAAATLPDGRVMAAGGVYHGTLSSTEIYDPGRNAWRPAAPLNTPRAGHALVEEPDGVLATGGTYVGPLATVELYSAQTNSWHEVE